MTHHLPHKNKYLHSTHPYLRSQDTFPVQCFIAHLVTQSILTLQKSRPSTRTLALGTVTATPVVLLALRYRRDFYSRGLGDAQSGVDTTTALGADGIARSNYYVSPSRSGGLLHITYIWASQVRALTDVYLLQVAVSEIG